MDIQLERSYATPVSNSPLLPFLLLTLARQKHTPHTSNSFQDEYDYIIVGGGSAGSVLASRLAEEPCIKVLLLEAGHQPPLLTEVPAFSDYLAGSDIDWNYKTVPQRHGASVLKNRQINWPSGKMLGGSGNFNGMAYVRGNRKDYDLWAAGGAEGWSYDDVLPYFLKLEDYTIPNFPNGYHAKGGPITVERMHYTTQLKQAIHRGAEYLGYKFVDVNAEKQTGFFDIKMNLRNGQRCSSVKGHLVPKEGNENLDILLNAHVTKVLIEENQVQGVKFFHEGEFKSVKARKEVILSAGAVNTPQILMLSGIGPKEQLEKHEIPVIADLPVGENFHDHVATQHYFSLDQNSLTFDEKLSNPAYILEYIKTRSGPLITPGHLYGAFLDGSDIFPDIDFPNISIFFFEVIWKLVSGRNLLPEVFNKMFKPYENQTIYQCSVVSLRPKSRGTVSLNSANPFDQPLIDPNYLEKKSDVQDLAKGLKICINVLKSPPLRKLGAKSIDDSAIGCEKDARSEDDYLSCYAGNYSYTYHHGSSTAKMGNPEDPTTVVDPQLRVKNIKGLRVADASIMPSIVSGNPNVPIMMIGEKAADLIKRNIDCSN